MHIGEVALHLATDLPQLCGRIVRESQTTVLAVWVSQSLNSQFQH